MSVTAETGEDRNGGSLRQLDDTQREYMQALYLDHYMALQSYAFRLGFRGEAVEDWLQETFLIAIRRVDELGKALNPRAYLIQILRNVIGNELRSMKYAARLAETLRGKGAETGEGYRDETDPGTLYRGLVSDQDLRLLLRFYLEGWSQKDLARELGIDVGACNMRLRRARAHLLAAMERDGLV